MVRYRMLEGRRHAVCPVVLLTVNVLPGSNGPLLYPSDEIAATVNAWAGVPVLVYHSELYSQPVAAAMPEVFDRQKIGIVFNPAFLGNRLKAEAWIDVERVQKVDDRVYRAIVAGKQMEVSTGLFVDQEVSVGIFNGREYHSIARNHRPDHLAILPDQVGACSLRDGCGLMRTNGRQQTVEIPTLESLLAY